MNNFPLVSVLMPVYNGEKYLNQAIDSILNQTYQNFEFLLINDGSTDTSRAIILNYSDARIRYLENEQNFGLIQTLNRGIAEANGSYIARMDADDVSRADRLLKQVDFLESNPSYGIVGSWCTVINTSKKIEYHTSHASLQFALLNYCCFVHPSVMIRKSVLTENQLYFDSHFVHSEDYEFWTRLLTITKAANLPDYLLAYREHEHQISSIYREEQMAMFSDIIRNYLQRLDVEIPERFIQLFTIEKLNVQHSGTRLIHLNGFYLYCLEKNIFDEKVLNQNLIALFKETFFLITSISLNDFKYVIKTELYKCMNLSVKQKFRFYLRIFRL
jgi:glycosyltransferase involved in cell wall biosynthesis